VHRGKGEPLMSAPMGRLWNLRLVRDGLISFHRHAVLSKNVVGKSMTYRDWNQGQQEPGESNNWTLPSFSAC
jgi:hypothetical protein